MTDYQLKISVFATTALFISLSIFIFYSLHVASRNKLKAKIQVAEIELNFEKELRKVEMEVSENMMQLFAEELHDNLGHVLGCMRIEIENKKLDYPTLTEVFKPIDGYVGTAIDELRSLSRSFNNEYIANRGFLPALQLEIDRIKHLRRFSVDFTCKLDNISLTKDQGLMLFRIFQEITHNALKHAKAKNLIVTISGRNGFSLEISDDGEGFDFERMIFSDKASGLKNIIKRAELAGLECKINAVPGCGCRYFFTQTVENYGE